MSIMIEKEINLSDLAETMTAQLDRAGLITFLEKLSDAMDHDERFDQEAAALFADLAGRWG